MTPVPSRRRRDADAGATLPLQLPAPSPLPGRIRPEFAVPCAVPFDAPGWVFTVDWAGMRALLFAGAGAPPRIQDERLADRTAAFPAVVHAALELEQAVVLDGVVTVLDPDGRPDLPALQRALAGADRDTPAVFLVTDLLHLDGSALMARPLAERLERLRSVAPGDACIQTPEWVGDDGTALAAAALQRGVGAVLARDTSSPYRAGVATSSRLTVSLVAEATAVVAGVEERGTGIVALRLAEYVDGRLVPAGRCPLHRGAAPDAWLRRQVARHTVETSPVGAVVAATGTRWLRPHLTATVTHTGRDPAGRLQGVELVAVRDDVDPVRCVRRAPVDPPLAEAPGTFRPAVLQALPIDAEA